MSLRLYNLITSANVAALARILNSHKGGIFTFSPLALRGLLQNCRAPDDQYKALIDLLKKFPLAEESQDELRTAQVLWAMYLGDVAFVKKELNDGTWQMRLFWVELEYLGAFCHRHHILPTEPALKSVSANLSGIMNELDR